MQGHATCMPRRDADRLGVPPADVRATTPAQAVAPGRLTVLDSSFPVACDCAEVRQTTRRKLWRLVVSGCLLAAQWGAYAWAVGHTSLAHTLLFLSATPVLLAGWHWAARQPISAGECISSMPLPQSRVGKTSPPAC